jgi:hypothetical protein
VAGPRASVFHLPEPDEPARWTGDSIGGRPNVTTTLSAAARDALRARVRRHLALRHDPSVLPRGAWIDETLERELAPVRSQIRDGRGVAIVAGLPVDNPDPAAAGLGLWIVGAHFGVAQSQSNLGDRIGEVTDVTATDPHARGYRSARELRPHTDICDMIALLAVRTARRGGLSSVASACTVHERLRAERLDLLARLYEGERYHRRGEESPGDAPITPHRIPVFSITEGRLNFRFVRPYMENALKAEGRTDPVLVEAFDAIERIATETALTFALEPGELLLVNNLTTLHARSAVDDWTDPGRKRLLLRLWLNERGFRPQSPSLNLYGDGSGVPHVPGRTASYANFY